jgi:hypothetical protein
MQVLLHGGNRNHPFVRFLQMVTRLFRIHRLRLEHDDAGGGGIGRRLDDLEAVLFAKGMLYPLPFSPCILG